MSGPLLLVQDDAGSDTALTPDLAELQHFLDERQIGEFGGKPAEVGGPNMQVFGNALDLVEASGYPGMVNGSRMMSGHGMTFPLDVFILMYDYVDCT